MGERFFLLPIPCDNRLQKLVEVSICLLLLE
jgi:hypothetical protein